MAGLNLSEQHQRLSKKCHTAPVKGCPAACQIDWLDMQNHIQTSENISINGTGKAPFDNCWQSENFALRILKVNCYSPIASFNPADINCHNLSAFDIQQEGMNISCCQAVQVDVHLCKVHYMHGNLRSDTNNTDSYRVTGFTANSTTHFLNLSLFPTLLLQSSFNTDEIISCLDTRPHKAVHIFVSFTCKSHNSDTVIHENVFSLIVLITLKCSLIYSASEETKEI